MPRQNSWAHIKGLSTLAPLALDTGPPRRNGRTGKLKPAKSIEEKDPVEGEHVGVPEWSRGVDTMEKPEWSRGVNIIDKMNVVPLSPTL